MGKPLPGVRKALDKQGFSHIACSEWKSSVKLEGEVEEYLSLVAAGKLAAKHGYKGVINEISVKGFTPPPILAPAEEDNSLHNQSCDVLIIGGGVIGCAIAREFAKYSLQVTVLEKEEDVAMHASSRNDGIIHPGIGTSPGTLKAVYNVRGNQMYTKLAQELNIPFRRVGNLVLYEERYIKYLKIGFMARAKQLGIEGRSVSKAELKSLEPHLDDRYEGGYLYPSSGILSPYQLTGALAENAIENWVRFCNNTIVTGMEMEQGHIAGVVTNRGTLRPNIVINAAGVYSDKVAAMANDQFFSIHPRKGEIAILDKKRGNEVNTSLGVFSLSFLSSDTKGGGLSPTIDNNILAGPNAYDQPYRENFSTKANSLEDILQKHFTFIQDLSRGDIITYFAGIRAATYEEDFIIEPSEQVDNLVYAAGIQSPGLASAPAIAEDVVKMSVAILKNKIDVYPNPKFRASRTTSPHLSSLSLKEKQQLIEKNPDYGVIICRCEEVSKGEIIDAIRSPLPAVSLDMVKRRVRPGMGRCQGGFCSPYVVQLIAEHRGCDPLQVTKKGRNSHLLLEKTRKGGEDNA